MAVCCVVLCWADELSKNVGTLFDDVLDEFCQVELIRGRFEMWKKDYSDSYNEAFIGLCLPKLFTPFVKLELVCWNPLEVKNNTNDEYDDGDGTGGNGGDWTQPILHRMSSILGGFQKNTGFYINFVCSFLFGDKWPGEQC